MKILLASLFVVACAGPLAAQSFSDLQVQDTFEGKDSSPGTIALVWPNGGQKSYSFVDLALKEPFPERHPFGKYSILIPAVGLEWHRYEAEALLQQQQTSKLAPEVLVDLALGDVACAETGADMHACKRIRPFIAAKYAIARNFIQAEWDGTFSALVSPFSIHPGYPGAWFPGGDLDKRLIRYTPSAGFERFANPAITGYRATVIAASFSAWTFTALLDAEIFPLNAVRDKPPALQRVSLRFQGAFRKLLSGDAFDSTLNALNLAVTYYFDDASRFGLSLTHENGKNPKGNFVGRNRDVLALTVKLTSD